MAGLSLSHLSFMTPSITQVREGYRQVRTTGTEVLVRGGEEREKITWSS